MSPAHTKVFFPPRTNAFSEYLQSSNVTYVNDLELHILDCKRSTTGVVRYSNRVFVFEPTFRPTFFLFEISHHVISGTYRNPQSPWKIHEPNRFSGFFFFLFFVSATGLDAGKLVVPRSWKVKHGRAGILFSSLLPVRVCTCMAWNKVV